MRADTSASTCSRPGPRATMSSGGKTATPEVSSRYCSTLLTRRRVLISGFAGEKVRRSTAHETSSVSSPSDANQKGMRWSSITQASSAQLTSRSETRRTYGSALRLIVPSPMTIWRFKPCSVGTGRASVLSSIRSRRTSSITCESTFKKKGDEVRRVC